MSPCIYCGTWCLIRLRVIADDPDRDVIANRDVIAELNITLNERDREINHLREDLHSVNHNLQLVSIK